MSHIFYLLLFFINFLNIVIITSLPILFIHFEWLSSFKRVVGKNPTFLELPDNRKQTSLLLSILDYGLFLECILLIIGLFSHQSVCFFFCYCLALLTKYALKYGNNKNQIISFFKKLFVYLCYLIKIFLIIGMCLNHFIYHYDLHKFIK